MSKVTSILLSLCVLLCLYACGSNPVATNIENQNNEILDTEIPNVETTALENKFVGKWKCDSWTDFSGDENKNAEIVLKEDGSGTIQHGDEWAVFRLTWEEIDENTILIFEENFMGATTGSEYKYEIIDGIPHLKFDNGKVTKDFYKQ
jgi:hypothetical protein